MKTSLISSIGNSIGIIKVSLLGITLLAFSACSKESIRKCQKWEVKDEGFVNQGCFFSLSCGTRTLQLTFCGDGLKDAYAGNTITIGDDGCCTHTRTFVRVIQ